MLLSFQSSPKNENQAIIYSLSCHSRSMTFIHQSAYLTDSLKRTGVIFCKSNITAHVMLAHARVNQIKSLLLSHHQQHVCRGDEKLGSVLQTVQNTIDTSNK